VRLRAFAGLLRVAAALMKWRMVKVRCDEGKVTIKVTISKIKEEDE
jgi:hypothetical protein